MTKKLSIYGLSLLLILSLNLGCTAIQNSNKTQRGAAVGAAGGALVGGLIGGNPTGALIGAAIGGGAVALLFGVWWLVDGVVGYALAARREGSVADEI